LRPSWKTYKCHTTYPQLDKVLKDNPHYKAVAAQAAQQTLQTVGESINGYNKLVELYYKGEVDRPSLPRYRKKGGLAAISFPKQALIYRNGCFYPSISRETKPELITEVSLPLPEFIDADWVREVRIRPNLGEFWIDWIIDDGKKPISFNPSLDYTQAWGFDHGGTNWLTGVSTYGKSFIIDGRKLKSMNQGYCRLVAKYKQGKSEFYWDANLDRIQRKRNNQMRDVINKAARFIINQCLNDQIGNLVIGWNESQKNCPDMGKLNNQNFVTIPTGRLIERLTQLCPEYGIRLTITEEANTSKASFLDDDSLPKHGEKPTTWKASGARIKRGLYRTKLGYLVNADANAAANIIRKVATQLGISLAEVGRGSLALPQRYDLFTRLDKSYRKKALRSVYERPRSNIRLESLVFPTRGDVKSCNNRISNGSLFSRQCQNVKYRTYAKPL
jgi:IS605 OrfB family transposase